MSRAELFDALDQGPGSWDVVQREIAIEALEAEAAVELGVYEDGFQFGAEEEVRAVAGEVERLDAEPVAGEDEAAARLGPEGQSEHAAKLREAGDIPFEERGEDGLGVGTGMKAVAAFFQFRAEFFVIVDLAVENDYRIAVLGKDGLVAGGEIDDFQAGCAEGYIGRFEDALLIGPAMEDGMNGVPDAFGTRGKLELSETCNAAQGTNVAYRL